MSDQDIVTENKTEKGHSKKLILLFFLLIILAGFTMVYLRQQKEQRITRQLEYARWLLSQGKLKDAIPILTEVIENDSERVEAYELRLTAYASSRSNDYAEQQTFYINAIQDIDRLIELQPMIGNHYVNRELVLRELAELPPDSATKFAIYELANENAEKAMELGVSPEYSYVYRHHARNLIESNHCEEGLQETQKLIAAVHPQDAIMDTYNIYLTEAYICLEKLDEALEVAEKIQCDHPVNTCRSGFMAEIYYQMGDLNNALQLLNQMIESSPAYGGWRYFIRAAIYYEMGEEELASQDLATGDTYTWYGNGVYWYVKARMAFDSGDNENGLLYLQYAESTLDIQYMPLRQKILEELIDRGGSPLVMTPQVPFASTPIP